MKFRSEDERLARQTEMRRNLMESALRDFSRQGYADTSIDSIAAGAGVSKGSVFNYFESKEKLRLESCLHVAKLHCAYMRESVLDVPALEDRLRVFFVANENFVLEHLDGMRFLAACANGSDSDLRASIAEAYRELGGILSDSVLGPGFRGGSFVDPNPEAATRLVMSILFNTSTARRPDGKPMMDPVWVADFVRRALSA